MISMAELRNLVAARLDDAEALYKAARYDGAVYLCGYALEVALKAQICVTLDWVGFPSSRGEFQDYSSFRTHDLDVLLHLSGRENPVRTGFLAEWSIVSQWDPEARYRPVGTVTDFSARQMIDSIKKLTSAL